MSVVALAIVNFVFVAALVAGLATLMRVPLAKRRAARVVPMRARHRQLRRVA
jgi:hypothetical protein